MLERQGLGSGNKTADYQRGRQELDHVGPQKPWCSTGVSFYR